MTRDDDIEDEDIHRFLDGELSDERRADLQARLARNPARAAEVFAEAQRMNQLRSAQPPRLFPKPTNLQAAAALEHSFQRRRLMHVVRLPVAAAVVFAAGWLSNAMIAPEAGDSVDQNFVFAAREALKVAQLDAGPNEQTEQKQEKIKRLVGAINIGVPPLPASWKVIDVQVQPLHGKQSLVVTAATPALGIVTLVAAPMTGEEAIPLTLASDGRVPTVYWQTGGTAYALMGPVASDRLEKEAKDIEVATRRNLGTKRRG